jgi:hypothetical protein
MHLTPDLDGEARMTRWHPLPCPRSWRPSEHMTRPALAVDSTGLRGEGLATLSPAVVVTGGLSAGE